MVEENQIPAPEFKPEKTFVISDFETLKAISDPARLQILETIMRKPRTVKEIAKIMSTNPTRLYYHINQLETHKLIQVVSTRIVSGVIEKSYQAVADNIVVAHDLVKLRDTNGDVDEQMDALLSSILNKTHAEILSSAKAGLISVGEKTDYAESNLIMGTIGARLRPAQFNAFRQKLRELIQEFDSLDVKEEAEDLQDFSFLFAFYPVQHSGDFPNQHSD